MSFEFLGLEMDLFYFEFFLWVFVEVMKVFTHMFTWSTFDLGMLCGILKLYVEWGLRVVFAFRTRFRLVFVVKGCVCFF